MDAVTAEIAFMATAAGKAFLILMEPTRLGYLAAGCLMGLVLGIVPGIGGLAGTAMLLPFTFGMDPYSAFALLLGLGATTATGDPIPAVLFGVPGGAGSAATVLDGLPMAKRGEAGRALSACYISSMPGGLFGAPLRGLVAAGFGIMLAMIGSDPQTGTLRWTMESLYLWEGLPLVPVVLGLFALPELADLAIARTAIAANVKYDAKTGMWQGAK